MGDRASRRRPWPHRRGAARVVHRQREDGIAVSAVSIPLAKPDRAWFGWDRRLPVWDGESFAARLNAADRARSTASAGTPDGRLRLLYRFADEQLSELRNGTVHAFMSLSLRPAPHGYLAYLAVYVRPVSWFTHLYMGAIAPFRRLVVYPALVRGVQGAWAKRYRGS